MIEAIYNHSPVLVQNVMCSVKGWLIDRKRFSKGFLRELRRMEARQDNPEEMLRNFLALARHVPAYAKVFADGRGGGQNWRTSQSSTRPISRSITRSSTIRRTRGRRLSFTRAARRARASTSRRARTSSIGSGPPGGVIVRNWASSMEHGTGGLVVPTWWCLFGNENRHIGGLTLRGIGSCSERTIST